MDLTELERPDEVTPKQFLLDLRREGKITTLQLRSAARRLDRLSEMDDVDDPVAVVLEELQTGKVKVAADDPESEDQLPKLADMGDDLSSKQKLLELREGGSLSPAETRVAARALDKGVKIEQALIQAGAERLLETAPAPEKELTQEEPGEPGDPSIVEENGDPAEDDQEDPEDSGDPQDDQEDSGDSGEDPDDSGDEDAGSTGEGEDDEQPKKPRTLGDFVKLNLDELRPAVEKINSKDAILELIRLEVQGKNREGGKEALVERAEELGVSDDLILEALEAKSVTEAADEAEERIEESTS